MSKRRRTSSASRGHEDDSLDGLEASTSIGPTMRKRKKYFDPVRAYSKSFCVFKFEYIFFRLNCVINCMILLGIIKRQMGLYCVIHL